MLTWIAPYMQVRPPTVLRAAVAAAAAVPVAIVTATLSIRRHLTRKTHSSPRTPNLVTLVLPVCILITISQVLEMMRHQPRALLDLAAAVAPFQADSRPLRSRIGE